jgi:hypothetical protein
MKIVRENLYEFERGDNSLSNLGIGERTLIKQWLDKYKISKYIINDDLTINVDDNVNLSYKKLDSVPDYIKFNIVRYTFTCSNNNLTSLEFCPRKVGRSFYCYNNKKQFTKEDVRSICDVKVSIFI